MTLAPLFRRLQMDSSTNFQPERNERRGALTPLLILDQVDMIGSVVSQPLRIRDSETVERILCRFPEDMSAV